MRLRVAVFMSMPDLLPFVYALLSFYLSRRYLFRCYSLSAAFTFSPLFLDEVVLFIAAPGLRPDDGLCQSPLPRSSFYVAVSIPPIS